MDGINIFQLDVFNAKILDIIRIMSVPIDADGMMTDILESLLNRVKTKFIYTIPTFQNPSGTVMKYLRYKDLA